MNYLAHLVLSGDKEPIRLGGILGDFYKGPIENIKQSPDVIKGIQLHRQLDAHSDHHPGIQQCVHLLGPKLRRTGGIIIDIVFDHFLAKHWAKYSSQTLAEYSQDSYRLMNNAKGDLPPAFLRFRQRAQQYDLLASYVDIQTVEVALERVAQRLSQPQRMAGAFASFRQQKLEIEKLFLTVFPQLQQFCQQQLQQTSLQQ